MSPTTSHPSTPLRNLEIGPHHRGGAGSRKRSCRFKLVPMGQRHLERRVEKRASSRMTEILPSQHRSTRLVWLANGYLVVIDFTSTRSTSNPTIPLQFLFTQLPRLIAPQSYSVGQLDPDSPAGSSTSTGPHQHSLVEGGRPPTAFSYNTDLLGLAC